MPHLRLQYQIQSTGNSETTQYLPINQLQRGRKRPVYQKQFVLYQAFAGYGLYWAFNSRFEQSEKSEHQLLEILGSYCLLFLGVVMLVSYVLKLYILELCTGIFMDEMMRCLRYASKITGRGACVTQLVRPLPSARVLISGSWD